MKKVMIFTAVAAASLIATKSYSQVYINAHFGFRVPGPRVYVEPAPVYAAPAPACEQPAPVYEQPAPVYEGGYYAAPEVCESEFPGYVYYNYPAWYGHYRDRVYFQHYRPWFERDHREYFYGGRFNRERWEHEGWEHDRGRHRGWDHERGWEHHGRHWDDDDRD